MNEKDFAELAAGRALHALSSEDEALFQRELAAHPEWSALVEADVETASSLGLGVALAEPPSGIRSALLAQIAHVPQGEVVSEHEAAVAEDELTPTSVGDPTTGMQQIIRGRRWTRSLLALAACLALLVGVGIGTVALNERLNRPASVVALEQIQEADDAEQTTVELDDGGSATAHWSASLGTAVLVTDGIPSLSEDQAYELWLIRDETPIPAGVFAAEDGDATAVLDREMHAGDVIAVTVEQAGGSPNGQPTSDPVVVIPTA